MARSISFLALTVCWTAVNAAALDAESAENPGTVPAECIQAAVNDGRLTSANAAVTDTRPTHAALNSRSSEPAPSAGPAACGSGAPAMHGQGKPLPLWCYGLVAALIWVVARERYKEVAMHMGSQRMRGILRS